MKLTENIELIDGTMANCYSVNLNGKGILIDAGMKSSGRKIVEFYRNLGVNPEIVLITHYHPDHVGGLLLVSEEFHPQIYVPDEELDVVAGNSRMTPAPGFAAKLVSSLLKSKPVSDLNLVSKLNLPGVQVIDTKGHTPASTSYFFPDFKALFVGDALVTKGKEITLNKAFTLNLEDAERSKAKIMGFHGVTIYPGHGNSLLLP
ncbi:MAG: MBL fold metallo-hydrolase [Thermoplasmataceae archaeon]